MDEVRDRAAAAEVGLELLSWADFVFLVPFECLHVWVHARYIPAAQEAGGCGRGQGQGGGG